MKKTQNPQKNISQWINSSTFEEDLGNGKRGVSFSVRNEIFFDQRDGNKPKKHCLIDKRLTGGQSVVLQSANCCVEVFPTCASYFDPQYKRRKVEKEEWILEKKEGREWRVVSLKSPSLFAEEIAGGLRAVVEWETAEGPFSVEYLQRDGVPLKHNISFLNTSGGSGSFRVKQHWTGINGSQIDKKEIVSETQLGVGWKKPTLVIEDDKGEFQIRENLNGLGEQERGEIVKMFSKEERGEHRELVNKSGHRIETAGGAISQWLDGEQIMTNDPFEISTMIEAVKQCPSKARVFIGGLGLGVVLHCLARSGKAQEIIVSERDQRVIDFVAPKIQKWFKKNYPSIPLRIINGDALQEVKKLLLFHVQMYLQ